MTTDAFTEAASVAANERFGTAGNREVWMEAAEWARTHLAAQETDAERAVRSVHRRIPVYEHETLCPDLHDDEHVEAHHHEDVGSAGDYYCDLLPVGPVCDTCRDEDGERFDYPCATIQALDSARAARRDEEKRNG